jgi:hypothetical protein
VDELAQARPFLGLDCYIQANYLFFMYITNILVYSNPISFLLKIPPYLEFVIYGQNLKKHVFSATPFRCSSKENKAHELLVKYK